MSLEKHLVVIGNRLNSGESFLTCTENMKRKIRLAAMCNRYFPLCKWVRPIVVELEMFTLYHLHYRYHGQERYTL